MTALLIDNLPLLAGAPNGIKKLRELILELAVRGKLVSQDPNDEPASELLKRIAEEKARLVAEGKIKRSKPLADINELDKPYELPAGWSWTTLPGAASYQIGKTPPTKESKFWDDSGQPWVSISDMEHYGEISDTARKVSVLAQQDVFKYPPVPAGTLLMSFKLTVGKVAMLAVDAYHNEAIISLSPFCGVSKDYLFRFLPSIALGGQQKNALMGNTLNSESMAQLLVPIPPLAEQHRIVAKVDELMALCDRLEARQADAESAHAQLVQALLDSLTQARDPEDFAQSWQRLAEHFHTLFTTESSIDALRQTLLQLAVMGKLVPQDPNDEPASDLLKHIAEEKAQLVVGGKIKKQKPLADVTEAEKSFALPDSWVWIRLEEIAQVGTGATPLRTNPKYFDLATVNWVTSGETSQDFIRETEQRVSALALAETNLTVYPPHTLIIAMYGQGKTRGQISELLIDACTNQACAAIQLFDPDESHRRYVKYFFVKSYDDLRMLAAGGAQPNLNLGKIKETVIPLPPLAEQHRIVAKVDQLMALCDQLKARLNQARQVHEQLANALVEQAVA
ncbi:restriction endonuclease subunit S [Stutzerimonas nitrititolerans]|uniref:restriction endonuclease subunit S n=1 Tax=Stutzerimonas nitrititolerans TaxID=2482751 RepID=UPI0028AA04B7|nr:restriction endonuclease subunit S [Stutzerimonas nitrititolerans]